MEIDSSRQYQPSRIGPLSPRIAPGPDVLERQLIRQQQLPPATRTTFNDDGVGVLPPVSPASWDVASTSVPGRPLTSIVRRPRRARIKWPWWWRWLCVAVRIERRLTRWWHRHVQRPPRRHRRR